MADQRRRVSLTALCLVAAVSAGLAQGNSSSDETEAAAVLAAGNKAWREKQFPETLTAAIKIQRNYAATSAAPQAYLMAAHALVALGDSATAMEELQMLRNREWPTLRAADVKSAQDTAAAELALLARVYLWNAKPFQGHDTIGPPNLQNIRAISVVGSGQVYWAGEKATESFPPTLAPAPPSTQPRGFALDNRGKLAIIEGGLLKGALPSKLFVARLNGEKDELKKIESAVQLSNGEWVVSDDEEKVPHAFNKDGVHLGTFQAGPVDKQLQVTRLAVNGFDEVAAVNPNQGEIVVFSADGTARYHIPETRDSFKEPRDLAFDVYGHLWILDQRSVTVANPYPSRTATSAPASAAPGRAGGSGGPRVSTLAATAQGSYGKPYDLRVRFAEDEKAKDGFHNGRSFGVDPTGATYIYDSELKRILVYR